MNRELVDLAHQLFLRSDFIQNDLKNIINEPSEVFIRVSLTNCGTRASYADMKIPKSLLVDYLEKELVNIKLNLEKMDICA